MVEAENVSELCGSGGKWLIGEEGQSTDWTFWDRCRHEESLCGGILSEPFEMVGVWTGRIQLEMSSGVGRTRWDW